MTAPPSSARLPSTREPRDDGEHHDHLGRDPGVGDADPLVVEFIGLPGAGKSTVAHALLPCLAADGRHGIVTVGARMLSSRGHAILPARGAERLRRAARQARFLARRRQLVAAVAGFGASVRPPSTERAGFAWRILEYAFLIAEHQARPVDVVVLDQAALQSAWSVVVRGSAPPADRVHRMLAELGRSARGRWAVVHLEVDREVALQRIAERPTNTSRFDHMAPNEARALLPGLQRFIDTMVGTLSANGVPCLRLDAHQPVEATCAALIRFVRSVERTSAIGPTAAAPPHG